MQTKPFYLFDTKKDIVRLKKQTLRVDLGRNSEENYKRAQTRMKIFDYFGALLYLEKAIAQNKYYTEAYNMKIVIYLDVNQFENAVLNVLKSLLIDAVIKRESKPTVNDFLFEYLLGEKEKIGKLKKYMLFYSAYADRFESYDAFAISLVREEKFELLNKSIEEGEYGTFLNLKEKDIFQ